MVDCIDMCMLELFNVRDVFCVLWVAFVGGGRDQTRRAVESRI